MARHALTIGLTALFAYLFADMLIRHMPLDFITTIIGAAAAALIWLRLKVWRDRDASPVPLRRVLWFYGLAFLIPVAFSISLEHSLNEFALLIIAIIAYVITAHLARVWPAPLFLAALRNASWLLIAVVAIIVLFSAATGRNLRPPSPNTLAAVFNLLLLPSLVEFAERPRRGLAVWIVAALAVIFVTASRGGWLGLAAGLVTLAARKQSLMTGIWSWVGRVWRVAVPAGAIVGGLLMIWQVTRTDHSTRFEFWIVAVAIFLYRPIVGAGPGTFNLFWSKLHPLPYFQAMHAHSLLFNTAAEHGIIGLIALTVLALAVLRASWRDAGLLAAVVAFGAHNLVDDLDKAPAVMIVLAVLMGSRLGGSNAFKVSEAIARKEEISTTVY